MIKTEQQNLHRIKQIEKRILQLRKAEVAIVKRLPNAIVRLSDINPIHLKRS